MKITNKVKQNLEVFWNNIESYSEEMGIELSDEAISQLLTRNIVINQAIDCVDMDHSMPEELSIPPCSV